ncbi:MAG: glycoside hydrolase [Candidatus Pacebacteria bacterium]|nr:glycoside hydrolase [Candidatus Paceibacterota bacterium]
MTQPEVNISTGLPSQPYRDEWRRSCPDVLVFNPAPDGKPRWQDDDFFVLNEHFIVVPTVKDKLLATWTAHGPKLAFSRVVVSRSEDGGKTWTAPDIIDGGPETSARWSVPIVAPNGRAYLLYSYYGGDHRLHGGGCKMGWRSSDDGGKTWSERALRDLRPSPVDADNGTTSFLFWRQAELDSAGRPLLAYTRLGVNDKLKGLGAIRKWTQSECLRIDNLDDAPACADLSFSYLPGNVDDALQVPQPEQSEVSWANEPSFVPLPDGRLFVCMRTRTGRLYWSCADTNGTFRKPRVMRYQDGGDEVLQPGSPAPLFRLDDKRYLLIFNNNDGTAFGATDTHQSRNRRPCYLALGRFDATAEQPLRFSEPLLFIDNDNIPVEVEGNEPRYEAAAYGSLTATEDGYAFWYPDRKHYLVGKRIAESILTYMEQSL